MSVELRLLGPLVLLVDGDAVTLAGRNQRAVLAMLALHHGRPLSSERLVDALWGENPPRTAITSVQNAVSQLRKLLGSSRLLTTPAGYRLAVPDDALDAYRFERLLRDAAAAEPERREGLLQEALALWDGDALADLVNEPFAEAEIRRLEELRLVAVEDLVELRLAAGRQREVIAELQSLVAREPLRERPRALLMRAFYLSGRQADALRVYQDTRRFLLDELGLEPGSELRELHGAVLRQERSLASTKPEGDGDHFERVARALLAGRLVPVVGMETGGSQEHGRSARQLAASLVERFALPAAGPLSLVAQAAAAAEGVGALRDELRSLLAPIAPGPLERFAASLVGPREAGGPYALVVTVGIAPTVVRAFRDAGVDVDLVSYLGDGPDRGRFLHVRPGAEPVVITEPNAYVIPFDQRPVVLEAHGSVDTGAVVREDDHIDYLVAPDPTAPVPVTIAARLRRSHLLFLGYPIDDWSVRVLLRRLWGDDRFGYRSWAVGAKPSRLARELWSARDVEVVDWEPEEYVETLARHLNSLAPLEDHQ